MVEGNLPEIYEAEQLDEDARLYEGPALRAPAGG